MSDIAPWREVPEGKQVNGFTGELEDVAPLSLNPDPAEQRVLSNNPIDKPLSELNTLFKEGKITLNGEEVTPEPEVTPEEVPEEVDSDVSVQTSSDTGDTEDTPEATPESN